jgi:hypothetical protein
MAIELLKITPRPNGRLLVTQYLLNHGQTYKLNTGAHVSLITHDGRILAESADGTITLKSATLDKEMEHRSADFRLLCYLRLTDIDGTTWGSSVEIRR